MIRREKVVSVGRDRRDIPELMRRYAWARRSEIRRERTV
jgi:hypothetical protein